MRTVYVKLELDGESSAEISLETILRRLLEGKDFQVFGSAERVIQLWLMEPEEIASEVGYEPPRTGPLPNWED